MTLTLKFDLLLKNFNLGCYLMMVAARRASLSSDNSYYLVAIGELYCLLTTLVINFTTQKKNFLYHFIF